MKTVLRIVLFLVLLLISYVGYVALFHESIIKTEQSVMIDAPVEEVFAQINNLKNFQSKWSPWTELDPDVKTTFSGAESGKGSKYAWESDVANVGKGTMEITESIPNQKVATHMEFDGMGTADAVFTLVGQGGQTQVTWDFSTDIGLMGKLFVSADQMKEQINGDYNKGLSSLKKLCEAN